MDEIVGYTGGVILLGRFLAGFSPEAAGIPCSFLGDSPQRHYFSVFLLFRNKKRVDRWFVFFTSGVWYGLGAFNSFLFLFSWGGGFPIFLLIIVDLCFMLDVLLFIAEIPVCNVGDL